MSGQPHPTKGAGKAQPEAKARPTPTGQPPSRQGQGPLVGRRARAQWADRVAAGVATALGCGCASLGHLSSGSGPGPGPVYQPTNLFCAVSVLPSYLRRVAVLPPSVPEGDWEAAAGQPALREVLVAELGKAQRFEVVAVSPDQMRDLSGQSALRPEEPIAPELVRRLRQQWGCDGVLFVHVQPYRAYPPLKLGWNLKLADLHSRQIIWAADEVFDASEAPVARAALRYAREQAASADDAGLVLTAPRRFAQYTLAALFARLPRH